MADLSVRGVLTLCANLLAKGLVNCSTDRHFECHRSFKWRRVELINFCAVLKSVAVSHFFKG